MGTENNSQANFGQSPLGFFYMGKRHLERVILIILSVKKINGDKKAARHGGIDGAGKGCVCNLTNSHARTTPLWPKLNASSQADIRMDCRKIDEIHQSPQKRC